MKAAFLLAGAIVMSAVNLSSQQVASDPIIRFDRSLDSLDSGLVLASIADSLKELGDRNLLPLALVRYRQGELGNPDRFLESESLLEEVVRHEPSSAHGWLFLGLVRAALDKAGFTGKLGPLQGYGEGYAGGAANALLRSLDLQPDNLRALQALMSLVEGGQYPRDPEELLPYLDAAVASRPDAPQAHLATVTLNMALERYDEADAAYGRYLAAGGDSIAIYVPDDRTPEQRLTEARHHLNDPRDLYLFQEQLRFATGNYDSALTAIKRYANVGGNRSRYLFEKSRILFAQNNKAEATLAYYQGAAIPPPAADMYRDDIAWLADSAEILEFELLSGGGRAKWLRDFWESRNVRDAQPLGNRLAEHHRRLVYAREHYSLRRVRRLGDRIYSLFIALPELTSPPNLEFPPIEADRQTTFRASPFAGIRRSRGSMRQGVDDRGIVYVRYGEPVDLANTPAAGVPQTESWAYDTPEGRMVLHFDGPFLTDFPFGDLMAQCELDANYCVIAGKRATGSLQEFDIWQVKNERRREAHHILHTDANPARFQSSLSPVVQLYGMPDGILAVYALSSENLHKIDSSTTGSTSYPLHVLLSAAGISNTTTLQIDSTGVLTVASPSVEGEYLSSIIEMSVPPGAYLTSLAISDTSGRTGSAVRLPHLDVPAFGSGELVMSDLILGKIGGLLWKSGGYTVALNPLGAYPAGGSAELYYQVDGQKPGKNYLTSITVMKGGDDAVVSLEFRETAASPRQWYHRSLGLARVAPGSYRVRVAITDIQAGIRISREQRLNVVR